MVPLAVFFPQGSDHKLAWPVTGSSSEMPDELNVAPN
jgi:hypothetical protein